MRCEFQRMRSEAGSKTLLYHIPFACSPPLFSSFICQHARLLARLPSPAVLSLSIYSRQADCFESFKLPGAIDELARKWMVNTCPSLSSASHALRHFSTIKNLSFQSPFSEWFRTSQSNPIQNDRKTLTFPSSPMISFRHFRRPRTMNMESRGYWTD